MTPIIYLCGDFSDAQGENMQRAMAAAAELAKAKCAVLCQCLSSQNPLDTLDGPVQPFVDYDSIAICDGVIILHGRDTPETQLEKKLAAKMGLPMFTSVQAVLSHFIKKGK